MKDTFKTTQQHLSELVRKGWTQAEIARSVDLPESTISYALRDGRKVNYEDGKRIELLNKRSRKRGN